MADDFVDMILEITIETTGHILSGIGVTAEKESIE